MTTAALALALLRLGYPGTTAANLAGAHILAATVARAAAAHGLDPVLLAAVAAHESTFHRLQVGKRGERGRWQILPATARQLGYTGSDEALANDPLNAGFASAWLAHVRDVCRRHGHTDPATWLSKYRGDRCRPTRYSKAILAAASAAKYPVATEAWKAMGLVAETTTTTRKDR